MGLMALACCQGAAAQSITPGLSVDRLAGDWQRAGLVDRVEQVTRSWLGKPYLVGPLGEGPDGRYDRDPLARFDGFDCVTFVETALSLGLSNSDTEFFATLQAIRYDGGRIDFVSRNHFTEVDWIPHNVRDGWFYDLNLPLESQGFALDTAVATIDKRSWYRAMTGAAIQGPGFTEADRLVLLPALQAEGAALEPEVSHLPYLPFATWLSADRSRIRTEVIEALPELMVASLVRPGWNPGGNSPTQLNISHQALLFKKSGELYLRHATSDSRRRVVEDRLIDYIQRNLSSPTLKGIHLLGIKALKF